MNTELRQSRVAIPENRPTPRARLNPTELFAQRDRLPWFWFLVAVAVTVLAAWDRQALVSRFQARERVVIIDPAQTYYVSPLLEFTEAKDLHVQQAELAALAFLQRNPKDFDQLELLKRLFLKPALERAMAQRQSEEAEFRSKSLHQKPEIAKVEILATREEEVLVHVSGQLIRTGIFQEKPFTEGLAFTLKLKCLRNPNLAVNGRFPMAVSEFHYEVTH